MLHLQHHTTITIAQFRQPLKVRLLQLTMSDDLTLLLQKGRHVLFLLHTELQVCDGFSQGINPEEDIDCDFLVLSRFGYMLTKSA